MFDLLQHPLGQASLWLAVVMFLLGVGVFAVRKLRERIDEDEVGASDVLSNFREMHQQGDLSDAEFRTIKTSLGAQFQGKSKNTGNTG